MLNQIIKLKTSLMLLAVFTLMSPSVFAQGHQEGHNGGNAGTINRGSGAYARSYGHRHYYHNGNWNRNGWYGWGPSFPVLSDGVLVTSLPPGYTTVLVSGTSYFYDNGTYFRQMPTGGFAVVAVPI